MNHHQALDLINQLEANLPVDEYFYFDVPIWPILRHHIAGQLILGEVITQSHEQPPRPRSSYDINSVRGYLRASLRDGKSNTRLGCKRDVLFLGDQLSRTEIDGTYYDRICDPLADVYERIGYTTALFEPLASYSHFPRYKPSFLISDSILKAAVKIFGIEVPSRLPASISENIKTLLASVGKRLAPENTVSYESVLTLAKTIHINAAIWESLLTKQSPKLVFIVQYYSPLGWSLCIACKRLGIPSIELPHGRQDSSHSAYARFRKMPDDGYACLPKLFWNWSERESATIDAWTSGNQSSPHQSFVGGNPFLEIWKPEDCSLASSIQKQLQAKKRIAASPIILATPEFCCDTIEPIISTIRNAPTNWIWYLRLHPTEIDRKEELEAILAEQNIANAEVSLPTSAPLYALLKNVDLLFTHFSTVIIEAKEMGIPSVSFSPLAKKLFTAEIETGWLSVADNERDCIPLLKRSLAKPVTATRGLAPNNSPSLVSTLEKLHQRLSIDLPLS